MFKFINEILLSFSSCFSRNAAFYWFCTVILGFMTRSDSLGITSFIRALGLKHSPYHPLTHFFHASSWDWATILYKWLDIVAAEAPLKRISGRTVLIGDGSKRASDGKYMPCLKKMVQESESASKPHFIHGHLFGAVGVLIGNAAKSFCLPLSMQVHDGDESVSECWGTNLFPILYKCCGTVFALRGILENPFLCWTDIFLLFRCSWNGKRNLLPGRDSCISLQGQRRTVLHTCSRGCIKGRADIRCMGKLSICRSFFRHRLLRSKPQNL